MTLQVLIVDDEPLARSRLRTLLANCGDVLVAGEAASAAQAMEQLGRRAFDAVLLDVQMPGADGVNLARTLRASAQPPAIVFVTAHAEHAVAAFEVEAVDYLTKPVRLERLQAALDKVQRRVQPPPTSAEPEILLIQDRGRTERVPLPEVLYFKAELKYVTVRTQARSYILDTSLSELEDRHPGLFLRVHRNALVARRAIRALEKHYDPEEGEGWAVRLNGVDELVAVSRRQLGAVREALQA
jgi:two-component system, LytTR family, response regulator AlgR